MERKIKQLNLDTNILAKEDISQGKLIIKKVPYSQTEEEVKQSHTLGGNYLQKSKDSNKEKQSEESKIRGGKNNPIYVKAIMEDDPQSYPNLNLLANPVILFDKNKVKSVYDGKSLFAGWFGKKKDVDLAEFHDKNKNRLYVGSLEDDENRGKGKFFNEEGVLFYDGHWEGGKPQGDGTLYSGKFIPIKPKERERYSSDEDSEDGKPKLSGINEILYIGNFVAGKPEGQGRYFFPYNECTWQYYPENHLAYYGNWEGGKIAGGNGMFKFYKAVEGGGGMTRDINFEGGRLVCDDCVFETNGDSRYTYRGGFKAGLMEDENATLKKKGAFIYKGQITGGRIHGKGKLVLKEKTIEGYFEGLEDDTHKVNDAYVVCNEKNSFEGEVDIKGLQEVKFGIGRYQFKLRDKRGQLCVYEKTSHQLLSIEGGFEAWENGNSLPLTIKPESVLAVQQNQSSKGKE